MAKNTLNLNMNGFAQMLAKLAEIERDIKPVTEEALQKAADKITQDTMKGVQKPELPAGGEYSHGQTEESVVKNPKVKWQGNIAEVGMGFDYNKPGAGGYLIKGRYRPTQMLPAAELNKIYTGKTYIRNIQREMNKTVEEAIKKKMGGG